MHVSALPDDEGFCVVGVAVTVTTDGLGPTVPVVLGAAAVTVIGVGFL